jgi:hypothetical protein
MKYFKSFIPVLILILFLFSCKEKAVDPDEDETESYEGIKEGFIKGTLTGNLKGDTTKYSYNLNFQGNEDITLNSHKNLGSKILIVIVKEYAGDGDSFINPSSITLAFSVPNLQTLSSPKIEGFIISATKDIGNNQLLKINKGMSSSFTSIIEVKNLNYNSVSGVMTGSFNAHFDESSLGGALDIADGTFSSNIYQYVE